MRVLIPTLVFLALTACGDSKSPAGALGGLVTGAGSQAIVGTYELDAEATWPGLKKATLDTRAQWEAVHSEEEMLEMTRANLRTQGAGEAVFDADGSFRSSLDLSDPNTGARGTWTLDGTKLVLTVTHEDGAKNNRPETIVGAYRDGRIHVRPDDAVSFDLVFRKKE